MDKVFDALADSHRRTILDRLYTTNGLTLSEICQELQMTRPGVSKHLGKLEEAELIVTVWRGREKLHFLNVVPLQQIYRRWIHKFDATRSEALLDLKFRLEASTPKEFPMKGFVYQIVISASPEKVWTALREPEFTQKYWFGRLLKSEWTPGATVSLITPEGRAEMTGKVLEFIPNKRLSYTWNTDFPGSTETVVTFDLEPFGPMTKLTIGHNIELDNELGQRAVSGWTMILSGLKTLLETGAPLPSVSWSK